MCVLLQPKTIKTDDIMATMKVTKSTMHRRVGDMTFYVRNGNMVVRARHNSSRTPKPTLSRMETRMRWKNCINLWRAFPPGQQPAFEGRRPGVSDYNLFLSHAMQTEPVYLTQQLADNGAAVLTSVVVSCGTLPEIGVTNDGTAPATDIALGSLTIGEGTTLGDLATAVVRNNAAFGFGDELLCYVGWQREDAARRVPVVAVECVRVRRGAAVAGGGVAAGLRFAGRGAGSGRDGSRRGGVGAHPHRRHPHTALHPAHGGVQPAGIGLLLGGGFRGGVPLVWRSPKAPFHHS